ncbi:hypothetical protein LTR35_000891 [Friedmanniomyces endolithicus]|uniref:Uncharacterized protein n=1 Tax=Friedmanniomyces endolithicus TaxID=329885 RepID=A0AAN6JAJ1_9PEZI|nr:hypothetical protein LTS00_011225 [Friedmanniomyces endolithicus]KAK0292860.1 hypothetical protein LTR35_000891 [Friedmanniomyces endolithicus]KAK0323371.1 hypothetical protein LTR82_005731 [Friedmanniomyces endolithicus]KAK1013491.1 hypothetical protein LTR54_004398 [Friedmanniomyces endolithicus]KAK1057866.1 hypothetical protein LTR74_013857 [Friedmanniomyces endolithicus]
MAAPANPFRTYAITGAVASITAVGAWYGAGLKARQEYKQVNRIRSPPEHTTSEVKAALDLSPSDRIEQMELAKARLFRHRAELQAKIDRLAAKSAGTGTPAKREASSQTG